MHAHLLGSLLLTDSHSSSQASPRPPLKRVRKAAPKRLPSPGRNCIAPADPIYMPDVVSDTAVARCSGGRTCKPIQHEVEPQG